MDLGMGVLAGSAVIAGVLGIIKISPKNKYVSQKLCDTRFDMLNKTMTDGFANLRKDIQGINKRIDKILEK